MKLNSTAGVDIIKMPRNIIQRTSPTKHTVDFPVRVLKKVVQEMRADHSRYARDEGALGHLSLVLMRGSGRVTKIFTILSADNACAVILQRNFDKAFLPKRLDHFCLNAIRRHEQQETTAARAAQFAAVSAETHRFVVG
jgi:ribosomal protein L44E